MKKILVMAAIVLAVATYFMLDASVGGVNGVRWGSTMADALQAVPTLSRDGDRLRREDRFLDHPAVELWQFSDNKLVQVTTTIDNGPADLCDRAAKFAAGWQRTDTTWSRTGQGLSEFLVCTPTQLRYVRLKPGMPL